MTERYMNPIRQIEQMLNAGRISQEEHDTLRQAVLEREKQDAKLAPNQLPAANAGPISPNFSSILLWAVVWTILMLVNFMIIVKITPIWERVFHDFGAELPWLTHQVIQVSYLLSTYYFFSFPLILGIGALLVYMLAKYKNQTMQNIYGFAITIILLLLFAFTLFSYGLPLFMLPYLIPSG